MEGSKQNCVKRVALSDWLTRALCFARSALMMVVLLFVTVEVLEWCC